MVYWPGEDETAGGLTEEGDEARNAGHNVLGRLNALRQAAHPVRRLVLLHLQGRVNQGGELARGEDTVQWRLAGKKYLKVNTFRTSLTQPWPKISAV